MHINKIRTILEKREVNHYIYNYNDIQALQHEFLNISNNDKVTPTIPPYV